ncbi:hypothetical protein DVH24_004292 [Malus domestica]|uniref:Apple domain-containing protein n=1 Tax=Malus domestica TaxID=3750 RepID=A0A498K5V4_MALDO|nr:hypothetical protein DVH24_004292 [Malus domestica]
MYVPLGFRQSCPKRSKTLKPEKLPVAKFWLSIRYESVGITSCCFQGFEPKAPEKWSFGEYQEGCVRTQPLSCQERHGFVKYGGVKLPDTTKSRANRSSSLVECRDICSSNCSVSLYTRENREEKRRNLFSPCAKVTATDSLAFNRKLGEGGFANENFREESPTKIAD